MTGYSLSYGRARMVASQNDVVWWGRNRAAGRKLVVLCHGYLGTSRVFADDPPSPNAAALTHALAAAGGFTMAAVDFGNSFGNATASGRVDSVRSWAATNLGTDATSVLLLGISMGNWTAWAYQRDYAGKVAGIVGIMPGSDLDDLRDNNRSGAAADVSAAWGVAAPPTPLPAGANPVGNGGLSAVPYLALYSTADAVVPSSTVTALASQVSGTATVISTSAAHGDGLLSSVPVGTVADWLSAHGA